MEDNDSFEELNKQLSPEQQMVVNTIMTGIVEAIVPAIVGATLHGLGNMGENKTVADRLGNIDTQLVSMRRQVTTLLERTRPPAGQTTAAESSAPPSAAQSGGQSTAQSPSQVQPLTAVAAPLPPVTQADDTTVTPTSTPPEQGAVVSRSWIDRLNSWADTIGNAASGKNPPDQST